MHSDPPPLILVKLHFLLPLYSSTRFTAAVLGLIMPRSGVVRLPQPVHQGSIRLGGHLHVRVARLIRCMCRRKHMQTFVAVSVCRCHPQGPWSSCTGAAWESGLHQPSRADSSSAAFAPASAILGTNSLA